MWALNKEYFWIAIIIEGKSDKGIFRSPFMMEDIKIKSYKTISDTGKWKRHKSFQHFYD